MNNCVLQKWVLKLSWKTQSALFTSIRSCDTTHDENVKSLVRWLRRTVLYDADVKGTFVKFDHLPSKQEVKYSIEPLPFHFVSHLLHGLQIIGYKADDEAARDIGYDYYKMICDILHCNVETEEEMDVRLKDRREKITVKN